MGEMFTGHDGPTTMNVYWSVAIFTSNRTSGPVGSFFRSERRHYVLRLSVRPAVRPAVRPSGHVFLYYANMVQQIEFIIYTNIQPLRQMFLLKVKVIGQRSRLKMGFM